MARGDKDDSPIPLRAARKSLGLSRSLVWIQEKNFEDKFDVVEVIG